MDKYNCPARICHKVAQQVVNKIKAGETSVKFLCEYGNTRVKEELNQVYKDVKKNIAFPFSISLNNCVGNYIYDENTPRYNTISEGDVIKYEVGVKIGSCIATLGDTLANDRYTKILDKLEKKVLKTIAPGAQNDDLKISIESYCSENNCFPVENATSYQMLEGQLETEDSKYIILNFTKYYDENDNLAVNQNLCFDFEAGEMYNINLLIVDNTEDDTNHKYTSSEIPHIYRYNDCHATLRLDSSRTFLSKTKKQYGTNAFSILDLGVLDTRSRIGLRDCRDKGIIDDYEVMFNKENSPVFHRKFTVLVTENGCQKLNYDN